jgi:hypothetical protein
VKKLQQQSGDTKNNLLSKIKTLKSSFKKQFLITLSLYFIMAITLELEMYYHEESNFLVWHQTPMFLRITCYIAFLVIQFFLKRYFYKRLFGRHIEELNHLIQQLQ